MTPIYGPHSLAKCRMTCQLGKALANFFQGVRGREADDLGFRLSYFFGNFVHNSMNSGCRHIKCPCCHSIGHPMGQPINENECLQVMTPSMVPLLGQDSEKASEGLPRQSEVDLHGHIHPKYWHSGVQSCILALDCLNRQ